MKGMPRGFRLIAGLLLWAALLSTASAQELTVYTMPPPRSLNWSTPLSLAFGAAVGNRFTFSHIKHKHTFGHVFIELRGPNGERELTGSTTAPDAPSDADYVTKRGYGLGVLFAPLQGALETPESLDPQMLDRYQTGRMAFMTFKLSRGNWARMERFLKEYRERGYGKIYNGLNRPREGLGAGCSIFGVVFLEIGGLMRPEFARDWTVSVRIPEKLIGGLDTGRHVKMTSAVLGRWAKPDEPHRVLTLYDPDLMFKWINRKWEQVRFAQDLHPDGSAVGLGDPGEKNQVGHWFPVKPVRRGKVLGLEIDCRGMRPPAEPLWQGEAARVP